MNIPGTHLVAEVSTLKEIAIFRQQQVTTNDDGF